MRPVDQAILNALFINMGYQPADQVAVAMQDWQPQLEKKWLRIFKRSDNLCRRMVSVFEESGVDVNLVSYFVEEPRNGADATPELYEAIGQPAIVFMPTVFSLTHTGFRRMLTEKKARVASMPTFTLDMFKPGGPMDMDYFDLDRKTKEIGNRISQSRYIRITAEQTDVVVEVESDKVHISSGLLNQPGAWGNLPGAEAYVPPVHEGKSNGHFTVPRGWGGTAPIKYPATFHIRNGRFEDVRGESVEAQKYIDREIKPMIFGAKDYNILAELGIGTNWNLTVDYIAKNGWSGLTAEKIGGSAHFANGNSKSFGGQNDVPIHIDWVVPNVTIEYGYQF